MPDTAVEPSSTTRARPAFGTRAIVKGIVAAGFVMIIAECLRIFVGSNFHSVVPGQCYRAGQPNAAFLDVVSRRHHIRSIINLRDENPDDAWYQEEKQAAERLHIRLFDAGLSSQEMAPAVDFAKVVEAIKSAPEPILIHCANGNDRSGLASAMYLLMRTKTSIGEARQQLHLRYGHIPWTKSACLGRVLDNYEAWLAEHGWDHNADRFHYWGTKVYVPELLH